MYYMKEADRAAAECRNMRTALARALERADKAEKEREDLRLKWGEEGQRADKAEAELQALRERVAIVLAQVLPGLQFNGNVPVTVELLRALLPPPTVDPLEAIAKDFNALCEAERLADRFRELIAKHGGEITFKDAGHER